jgi:hypothetical protein
MPSKLKHILIERPGDRKIITENIAQYRQKTNAELIESYNKQQALGLVGSWPQALMCFSLCIIFKERFGKSPVLVENFVLSLTEPIVEVGDNWEYVETPETEQSK